MSWLKVNFARWGNDPGFRAASNRALGAWVRLVFAAAGNVEDPGRLVRQGRPLSAALIAGLVGMGLDETEEVIGELLNLGLVERDDAGALVFAWVIGEKKYFDNSLQQKVEAGRKGGLERNKRHPQTPKAKQTPSGARGVLEQTPSRPLAEGKRTPTTYIQTDIQTDIQTQQHAPEGGAGDAAAAEMSDGEEGDEHDEEHDERLLALAGLGITGSQAEKMATKPWMTTAAIRRQKAGRREGEGTGLLIERLMVDEKARWEASVATELAAMAAEEARSRALQDQRSRMEREARVEAGGDEGLLAETDAAELVRAMKNLPDLQARNAIRNGRRDDRGLPVDPVLRHHVAAEVRKGTETRAALAGGRAALGLAV